jgi:hypothetical protein
MTVTDELAALVESQIEDLVADWPTTVRPQARKVLPRLLTYEGDDALLRGLARDVAAGGQLKISQLAMVSERLA